MDDWEDIDENLSEEEEEEEMIVDYCSECDEPILEGDVYETTDDGRDLCETCYITLYGGR